jgi:hypothetical protein
MATDSFVRVPPDSTGKRLFTQEHTVGGAPVQVQVQHLADYSVPDQFLAVDNRGSASVRFAEGQPVMSGFGNLKVAEERALGVYESSLDTYEGLFSQFLAGDGAVTYIAEESSEVLTVGGASGASSRITTNRYHYYMAGTSNVYKMTIACGDVGKANNVRRWGAFDADDGAFFELSGTTLNVVIRSSTSGSVTETRVAQAAWNSDKLNGTGLSGVSLDITKINVWWLDYQWLGAGRVRFGIFAPSGERVVCHEFENAGSFALPYMRTGTLPFSVENTNTGAAGSGSQIRSVCAGIYCEGNVLGDYTFWRYSGGVISKNISAPSSHLGSIRLQPTVNDKHNSVQLYPETLNVYCDQPVSLTVALDTAVTGGTWNQIPGSVAQANLDGTYAPTVDTVFFKTMFFGPGSHRLEVSNWFELNDEGLLVRADGTSVVWSFLASPLSASPVALTFNIGYRELW